MIAGPAGASDAASGPAGSSVPPPLSSSMQCNIDARGKAVRLLAGSMTAVLGAVLLLLSLVAGVGPAWLAWAGGGMLAAGLFGVFEGWAGWCALRAMGVRTRL